MLDRTELIPVADGERRRIGPVECQFIPVTHSVPHGFAIAFFTPVGTIIHSGDFKLDLTPVDGRRTNLALLGDIASRDGGVRLLHVRLDQRRTARASRRRSRRSAPRCGRCSASIPTSGSSSRASRRTCTACSRSRRPRSRNGRKLAFVGRSMQQNITMARERGFIDIPDDAVIDIDEAPKLAPGEVCIVCTGSQGEPMSALVADGRARAQAREGLARRRRGDQRARDPRQRVERVARHRLAAPRRRRGRARPHVAGARVGPRVAGGAEVPAQPARARVVRAGARRVPPPRAPRAARARRRRRPTIGSSSAKTATSSRSPPTAPTANGGRCPRATCTSTASSATSATACCATARALAEEGVVVVIVTVDTPGRRDRHRPGDRHPRLGLRARGRGPLEEAKAAVSRRRSTARSPKARSTSTRCAATPAVRSASSSTSARGAGRS